ncbi:MAG: glycosyltransferase [Actinomycetota bacterium]|nr:glycosyltransferase [Actinomycetota bacterium]
MVTRLNVGGHARQALFLTKELPARGFQTRLVWGTSGRAEGELTPTSDIPATHMPWLARELSPSADLRTLQALSGVIRRWRPQVVHTHLAKAGALGRLAARRMHVPVVVHTFHGHVLQQYFSDLKNAAFAAAERALAARTDALIAVAPQVRDDLLAKGIGREDQWHVVPVGVDLATLLRTRSSPEEARARLGLPTGGSVIGVVGRLAPVKDHRTFFEAAARLLSDRPDTTVVVAGDGQLRESLEAEARLMLGDRVRFLGWVEDLPSLYGALDVVVLTSRSEGTPVALIEAAASGTPVVATGVGGVPEVVRDRETGLLVPPRDPVAVAAQILTLLQDPQGARKMGEEGADWVRDRFSQDRLADDLTGLYMELLARSRGANASRPVLRTHVATG